MYTSRFLLGTLLVAATFSTLALAQERPARRLDSVTWNPRTHTLTWSVSEGKLQDGNFVEAKKHDYRINMDRATMSAQGEDRRFSKDEAVSVHALMDLVSKYAAESTLWWDAGQGEPLKKDGKSLEEGEPDHGRDEFREKPRKDAPGSKTIRIRYEQ
jgi:hypothetical protein